MLDCISQNCSIVRWQMLGNYHTDAEAIRCNRYAVLKTDVDNATEKRRGDKIIKKMATMKLLGHVMRNGGVGKFNARRAF